MMIHDQDLLFGDVEPQDNAKQLSRAGHPSTSKEAAKAILDELPRLYAYVLGAVSINTGATASELAAAYHERDTRRIGRRLPELEAKGLIRRGNPRLCKITKRLATTWWPV